MPVASRLRVVYLIVSGVADAPQPVVLFTDEVQSRDGERNPKRLCFPAIRFKAEIEAVKAVLPD